MQSGSKLPQGLALSTGGVLSGTPATAGTNTFTVVVTDGSGDGDTATQKLTLTVQAATPPSPHIPVWVPPVVTPHTVTIDGQTMQVIEGYGLNTGQAIANGTVAGFVEERSALASGVTLTGEGVDSSYLFSIMDRRAWAPKCMCQLSSRASLRRSIKSWASFQRGRIIPCE